MVDQTGNETWSKQGTDDTLQTEQATDRGPVSFDLLAEFPTHADALREIERLRALGDDMVLWHSELGPWATEFKSAVRAWQEARRV